eukprot:TRINITY_DN6773_c0_g1_i1.p1 TRINITY_DN6773_c0_g1~~TRINITY_DN6773_c0_g1_i1.p1  ORF type:complete len:1095 (+),score=300.01 TRINITY_DN6773_c0_g1_i1:125-3409(+)
MEPATENPLGSPKTPQLRQRPEIPAVDAYGTNNHSISVGYRDDYGAWGEIQEPLRNQLPLKNLTVRIKGLPTLVEQVNVSFLSQNSERFHYAPNSYNWYTRPFVYIFFIRQCPEVENYKKDVKPKIQDWLTNVNAKNGEWLIVYVTDTKKESGLPKIQLRSTFDKIRGDFNSNKRDRCCQIRLGDPRPEQIWDDFVNKLKESITITFETTITQYEEELRTQDNKRLTTGWNFNTFFLLKEGLAFTYQRMGLLKQALALYIELNAALSEKLSEGGKKKMENFGGTERGDDSCSIFDTAAKPFRLHILNGSITEFDFRKYLFARDAELRLQLESRIEVVRLASNFVAKLHKDVKAQRGVVPYFSDCWVYSASMDIVRMCENKENSETTLTPTTKAQQGLDFMLGDLYYNARTKLDVLGIACGLLSKAVVPPYTPYKDTPTSEEESDNNNTDIETPASPGAETRPAKQVYSWVTHPDLEKALRSTKDFDNLYMSLTQKASKCYEKSSRYRSVVRLNGEEASLHFRRGRYLKAETLLKFLCPIYSPEGWQDLVYNVRAQLAECQRRLKHESEYISSCIGLLSLPADAISNAEREFYLDELFYVSQILATSTNVDLTSLFRCQITKFDSKYDLGATMFLECKFYSMLPKEVMFDRITIRLATKGEDKEIIFEAKSITLAAKNWTSLRMEIQADFEGEFSFSKVSLETGKLSFSQSLRSDIEKYISIVSTESTVRLSTNQSEEYLIWGVMQQLAVKILLNKERIREGFLEVQVPSEEGSSQLEISHGTIPIGPANSGDILEIPLPIRAIPTITHSTQNYGTPDEASRSSYRVTLSLSHIKNIDTHREVVSQDLDLNFIYPFDIRHSIICTGEKTYIQVLLRSKDLPYLEISRYTLKTPMGNLISTTCPAVPIRFEFSEEASILFEIDAADAERDLKDSHDCVLSLETLFPDQTVHETAITTNTYTYQWIIPVIYAKTEMRVDMVHPRHAYLGNFFQFEFSVSFLPENMLPGSQDENGKKFRFEIRSKEEHWVLSGCRQKIFNLKYGDQTTFKLKALPLVPGLIPLPTVTLHDGTHECQIKHFGSPQICIFPRALITPLQP